VHAAKIKGKTAARALGATQTRKKAAEGREEVCVAHKIWEGSDPDRLQHDSAAALSISAAFLRSFNLFPKSEAVAARHNFRRLPGLAGLVRRLSISVGARYGWKIEPKERIDAACSLLHLRWL
jgi:hypothetical protein